jgi:hypothetical protein
MQWRYGFVAVCAQCTVTNGRANAKLLHDGNCFASGAADRGQHHLRAEKPRSGREPGKNKEATPLPKIPMRSGRHASPKSERYYSTQKQTFNVGSLRS